MAKKITYLLGAGASANTIPVVNQMTKRIEKIRDLLKNISNGRINRHGTPTELHINFPIVESWVNDLTWLLNEVGLYYSVDTLARKYFLTAQIPNLNRLKKCVILYFTVEQFIYYQSRREDAFQKEKIDNRYDSLFATIGNVKNQKFFLNNDVKILSWNYDVQIELCLQRFFNQNSLSAVKKLFNIHPNGDSMPVENNEILDSKAFGVVKLNGNAFWERITERQGFSIFDSFESDAKIYSKLIDNMNSNEQIAFLANEYSKWDVETWQTENAKHFNFAWEYNNSEFYKTYNGHANIINEAARIAKETDVLVVIGYSFPIFNREIDNYIFSNMIKLKKVYIQDINPERVKSTMSNAFDKLLETETINKFTKEVIAGKPSSLRDDFVSVPKIAFQLETSLNQFVIPYELNQ